MWTFWRDGLWLLHGLVRFPNPLASTVDWGTSPWSSSTSSPSSLSLWPVGRWSQIPLTRSIAHTVPILVQLDICCKNSFAEVCHILKTILFKKLHTTAGRKGKSSLCIVDPAWTRPVHSRETERDYWARGYLLISPKKLKLTEINCFLFRWRSMFSYNCEYHSCAVGLDYLFGGQCVVRFPNWHVPGCQGFQEEVGWGTRPVIWHNNTAEISYMYQYSTADDWNWIR